MLSSSYDHKTNHFRFLRVSEVPVEFNDTWKLRSWIPDWIINLLDGGTW